MSDNSDKPTLTTSAGAPIADNQNSLSAGPRGPLLLQDTSSSRSSPTRIASASRARRPRQGLGRARHAHHHRRHLGLYQGKGAPAGRGDPADPALLDRRGASWVPPMPSATCAALRSNSTRPKAIGIWVGNNTPVFFVRDPLKFPDFIHTQKRHPRTNLRSPTAMWDFWSLSPESLHQVTILMSDRGLPTDVRHINGYGSHTYSLIN